MLPDILWHGSRTPIDTFFQGKTELHLGTKDQAKQFGPHLYAFRLSSRARVSKSKDTGETWGKRARSARKRKKDALVYLNRFEGLDPRVFDDLAPDVRARLDHMPDAEFLKHIPQATYSVMVVRPDVLTRLNIE